MCLCVCMCACARACVCCSLDPVVVPALTVTICITKLL